MDHIESMPFCVLCLDDFILGIFADIESVILCKNAILEMFPDIETVICEKIKGISGI